MTAALVHTVNGWLKDFLGSPEPRGGARSVIVPSPGLGLRRSLHTAVTSLSSATVSALQKKLRSGGFKNATVEPILKGDGGGFLVQYQGQEYTFWIDEAKMRNNGRGLYHGLGPSKNDMVLHQDHRGRWRIDLITSAGGNHQTIGTTKGYGGSSEAAREAGREAHKRGISNGLLYQQEADGSYGLHYEQGPDGRTARLRDLKLMPNARKSKLLPSQRNEPSVRRDVLTDFMNCPAIDGTHTPEALFEHDAWWVQCKCGAQWSVVDTSHGFDFEQVSEGDEGFHGDHEPNGRRTGILSDGTRVNVYHDPVGGGDAYTTVPHSMEWDEMERGGMREMLGTDASGRGFSQWTTGQEGRHLGRKLAWDEVPEELKRHIEQRVAGEKTGMVANARKVTIESLKSARGSGRPLVCTGCGEHYSSDPSDYFWMEPGQPFVCGNCGEPLKLGAKPKPRKPTALEDSWAEDDYVVSVIDRDGTIGLFRIQRGDWQNTEPLAVGYKLDQISEAAEADARSRGVQDAVIFDADDGTQIGHVLQGRWQVDMNANARGSTVDEHAQRELTLYIENEYALIGADNSIGKAIDKNMRRKVASGKYDPALAPKGWQHLIDEGAKRYAKAYSAGNDHPQIFSAATRRAVAADFARAWEAENITASEARSLGLLVPGARS